MKQAIRDAAARIPPLDRLLVLAKTAREALQGHYYSPVPNRRDIARVSRSNVAAPQGIDLNETGQKRLLDEFVALYAQSPFRRPVAADVRYSADQNWFGPADANYLYCFLRKFRPAQIIEVGSGFSSAVMLDTAERYLDPAPRMTFVEPDPRRLVKLLRPADKQRAACIKSAAQDVPVETYASLAPGDLLFIDSSHVLKRGSDVQFLLFDVLPALAPGVHVHFHDIHYPFEYPDGWLNAGRYWNEAYALRAFLAFNTSWKVTLFADYAAQAFGDFLRKEMPLCLSGPSSLYIQRTAA